MLSVAVTKPPPSCSACKMSKPELRVVGRRLWGISNVRKKLLCASHDVGYTLNVPCRSQSMSMSGHRTMEESDARPIDIPIVPCSRDCSFNGSFRLARLVVSGLSTLFLRHLLHGVFVFVCLAALLLVLAILFLFVGVDLVEIVAEAAWLVP